jgi:ATP-dependent DNA ligase
MDSVADDALVTPSISALALQHRYAFRSRDRIFEIKFDGFRSLANIENGKCNLVSRKENAFKRFPDLRVVE